MHHNIAALAATQGGAFTRAQALAAGVTDAEIRTHLRRKEWVPLRHGIYTTAGIFEAVLDDPLARHVLQAAARVLSQKLDVAASHRTGALVHSLAILGDPPRRPQLTRTPRFADDTSATKGVYVATLPPNALLTRGGIPVTTLGRTACDVARTTDFRSGVVTADSALRAGLTPEQLRDAARLCADWPGGRRAAAVAGFADGRAETPLESITRVAYLEEGLPPPETQVEVYAPDGRLVAIVDFLWRSRRTVGEADGMLKYDAPGALRLEKLREEDLRACGLEVVRNSWDDAWQRSRRRELGRRVRQAFGFAARQPDVPGVGFRTPSLEELTRRHRPFPDQVAS